MSLTWRIYDKDNRTAKCCRVCAEVFYGYAPPIKLKRNKLALGSENVQQLAPTRREKKKKHRILGRCTLKAVPVKLGLR